MPPVDPADAERRLLLDALVSYSDACTLPNLTPSCPFFRVGEEGPTCGEECREIAERRGAATRPVQSAQIGGLVLLGRALPIASAAGVEVFDAGQLFMEESRLPVGSQSTTSLLLNLAAAIRPPMFADQDVDGAVVHSYIDELQRRSIPVSRVLRSSVADQMAEAIALRVAIPLLARIDAFPTYASSSLLERTASIDDPWRDVLEAYANSFESIQELETHMAESRRPLRRQDLRDRPFALHEPGDRTRLLESIASDPKLTLALSQAFSDRVTEWLSRLLEEGDFQAFIACDPPPPSVLLALRPARVERDEVGLWIWERFTVSDLAEWSTSSLLLEWRAGRGESVGGCSRRALAARPVDQAKVADLALEQSSMARGRRRPSRGLAPDGFVNAAAAKLEADKAEDAAEIFGALLELRPLDGQAWNNYGFCLMAVDPKSALLALQRASLYELEYPVINLANRAFSFHHLGDSTLARAALSEISVPDSMADHPVFAWRHDVSRNLLLSSESVSEYVLYLRQHMDECEKRAVSG